MAHGDERLVAYVNAADVLALVVATTLLVVLVSALVVLRRLVLNKTQFRLAVDTVFLVSLIAASAAYYLAFIELDTALVRYAAAQSFTPTNAAPRRSNDVFIRGRAQAAVVNPEEFVCVYPGWLVLAVPFLLVPASIVGLSALRRGRPNSA